MRLSPSESATLFDVGTIKLGNDGNYWKVMLTSNNVQRWVKDKNQTNKDSQSRKSSTKKISVKRKTSTKKRSVKRKTSTKKRSVKRNTSTKKRSVKRNTSTKKRSVKRKTSIKDLEFNQDTFTFMLAHKYAGQDPTGYYLSEKLDGYRAIFYNGQEGGVFLSRNKKPFNAPKKYLDAISKNLPKGIILDGELYTKDGRGRFDEMGVIRKKIPIESEWNKIVFMVFDLPLVDKPFEERYKMMLKLLKDVPHIQVVKHIKIKDNQHLNKIHNKLVSEGAEGTMLRKADSYYEKGRSNVLLKVKDFHDDEAIVDDIEFGEGRNKNVMGNLIVHWAPQAGKSYKGTFKVGSGFTDEQRTKWKTLFKKDTVITVKYFELQKSGKPRFPIFQNIYHKV